MNTRIKKKRYEDCENMLWISAMKHMRVEWRQNDSFNFLTIFRMRNGNMVCRLYLYIIHMDKVRCNKHNASQQYQNNSYDFILTKTTISFPGNIKWKKNRFLLLLLLKMKHIPQYKRFLLLFCASPCCCCYFCCRRRRRRRM